MAYNISALPAYTSQTGKIFITKSILGAATIALLTSFGAFDPTAKGSEAIQLLDTDVVVQENDGCGRNPMGGAVLDQEKLTVRELKVNQNYCVKVLTTTWAVEELKATMKGLPYTSMLFQTDIANLNSAQLALKIEKMIWLSDPAVSALESSLKLIPGFIKQIVAKGTYVNLKTASGIANDTGSIITLLQKSVAAMPIEVTDQEDFRIIIGRDWEQRIVAELAEKNLYNPALDGVLFGTKHRYVALPGLNGTHKVIMARVSRLRAGGEMATATFTTMYSVETKNMYMDSEFSLGVVPVLVNEMGYGDFTAA